MARFLPIERDSVYFFPPSVQDWLPETHLARHIANVIESLDLSGIERAYAGRGSDAYHPASLMSLLIYGYATGVFSSRKIEMSTYDSIAFRYLACNRHPDHDPWPPSAAALAISFRPSSYKSCKSPRPTNSANSAPSASTVPSCTPMPAGTARCPMSAQARSKLS